MDEWPEEGEQFHPPWWDLSMWLHNLGQDFDWVSSDALFLSCKNTISSHAGSLWSYVKVFCFWDRSFTPFRAVFLKLHINILHIVTRFWKWNKISFFISAFHLFQLKLSYLTATVLWYTFVEWINSWNLFFSTFLLSSLQSMFLVLVCLLLHYYTYICCVFCLYF